MTERTRPAQLRDSLFPGGGAGDPFGAALQSGLVGVSCGPHSDHLPLAGRTVAQVRARFGAHFDIDPRAEAVVGGQPVAEDTVLRAGQLLSFSRPAGEKGAQEPPASGTPAGGPPASLRLAIEGEHVTLTTPEGGTTTMPLADWLAAVRAPQFQAGNVRLPAGVVGYRALSRGVVLVHESPPCVRRLRWVADDSPAPFGLHAVYRDVSLALPWVLTLVVFVRNARGELELTSHNEAFFMRHPLVSFDDELCYPALLNCSRMKDDGARPLAWICVQHLPHETWRSASGDNARLRAGTAALIDHLYNAAFNRSADVHELSSWYTETVRARVDERFSGLAAWERESAADPTFMVDVPWLPTGHSLSRALDRVARRLGCESPPPEDAGDLARIVLLPKTPTRRRAFAGLFA